MPANFLPTLKREIEELEIELAADPKFVKLQKLRDVLAVYDVNPSSGALATPQASSKKPTRQVSPDRERALALAESMLEGRAVPTPTRDIVERASQSGVTIPGKDPISNMSAMLSNSDKFQSHGRTGWTLVTPAMPHREGTREAAEEAMV